MSNGRLALFFAVAAFAATVMMQPVWAADHTPVFSDGMVGVAPTAGGAQEAGVMPSTGSGKMSNDLLADSLRGLIPTRDQIKNLQPAGGNGIETVIGTDTRLRTYGLTYPARATALITFTGGWCTGWFYSANTVATAGHCVHGGPGSGWKQNVRVYPGYDAGLQPYGSYAAKWIASVTGWTQNGDERYDYGVIKLSSNAGSTVGWYGIWWQTASLNNTTAIILGYPGDKSPTQSQWVGIDRVRVTQERQVFYKNDTFGGMSGSAVWEDRPAGSAYCANGPCAYAIHAYGLHGGSPHSNHNHGTRIVQAVYNNLIAWRNAP